MRPTNLLLQTVSHTLWFLLRQIRGKQLCSGHGLFNLWRPKRKNVLSNKRTNFGLAFPLHKVDCLGSLTSQIDNETIFFAGGGGGGGGFRDRGFSRGGPRGGPRGRPANKPKEPLKFEEDFDFESMNAKFDKENIIEDLKKLNISKFDLGWFRSSSHQSERVTEGTFQDSFICRQ